MTQQGYIKILQALCKFINISIAWLEFTLSVLIIRLQLLMRYNQKKSQGTDEYTLNRLTMWKAAVPETEILFLTYSTLLFIALIQNNSQAYTENAGNFTPSFMNSCSHIKNRNREIEIRAITSIVHVCIFLQPV